MRFDLLRDRVKIRPFSGFEFGVNEFTVDANFKSTSAGRDQLHRLDPSNVANFGRQTGGSWFIVSNRAVFDRDACFHRAPSQTDPICGGRMGQSAAYAELECIQCLLGNDVAHGPNYK